jgi:hypothetical protein
MAEPESSLFPQPFVGPVAEPIIGPEPSMMDLPLTESIPLSATNLIWLMVALVYTRWIQGKTIWPLKWVGWSKKTTEKRVASK